MIIDKCHWMQCEDAATVEEKDRRGEVWTVLCRRHADELESAIKGGNAIWMLSCWVKAQGGSQAASQRTINETPESVLQRYFPRPTIERR